MEYSSGPQPTMGDILSDQLQWLIEHSAECKRKRCRECRRFEKVRHYLLKVFFASQ